MEHDNAGTANATADEGNMDELFNSAIRLRRYGVSEGAALSMLNLGCINMASGRPRRLRDGANDENDVFDLHRKLKHRNPGGHHQHHQQVHYH